MLLPPPNYKCVHSSIGIVNGPVIEQVAIQRAIVGGVRESEIIYDKYISFANALYKDRNIKTLPGGTC